MRETIRGFMKNEIITENQMLGGASRSFVAVTSSVEQDTRLSWFEKYLYSTIAGLTNKNGYCFARNEYLAERLNVSKNHVSKAISTLVKYQLLRVELEPKCNKGHVRKVYMVDVVEVTATVTVPMGGATHNQKELPPTSNEITPLTQNDDRANQINLPLYKVEKKNQNLSQNPSIEQLETYAKERDIDLKLARAFHEQMERVGWKDDDNQPIRKWGSYFKGAVARPGSIILSPQKTRPHKPVAVDSHELLDDYALTLSSAGSPCDDYALNLQNETTGVTQ